ELLLPPCLRLIKDSDVETLRAGRRAIADDKGHCGYSAHTGRRRDDSRARCASAAEDDVSYRNKCRIGCRATESKRTKRSFAVIDCQRDWAGGCVKLQGLIVD